MNCMEEHSSDNPICGPVKKYKAPDLTNYVVKSEEEPGVGETPNENNENKPKEDDDIAKFIKSGKKIHPAAMDRISRERAERKIQADMYSRQQAEQEALNQSN